MKRIALGLIAVCILSTYAAGQNRYWVAAGAGNWNNTANWSTTNGGASGASVPGAANTAIFNGNGLGNCNLDISPTVSAIQLNAGYTGIINLQGNTLTVNGTSPFNSGTINNSGGSGSVVFNSAGTTTFAGTTFGANITGTTGSLYFNGSTFNGTITLTKSDNNTNTGDGGNTFNGTVSLTHSGTGELRLANTNPDAFNNTLTLAVNNTGDFVPAYGAANSIFNANIIINYTNTGDVRFGANGGSSRLNHPFTITTNCAGSGCDDLQLQNFTMLSTTPQTISLSGSGNATLTLGPNSTFAPTITGTVESLVFNTSTFTSAVSITHTGANTSNSVGPSTFSSTLTLTNTGTGDLILGNSGTGDIFNGNVILNNSGGARIRLGESTAGNLLNANLTINNSAVTDINNRTQISRLAGSSTTINGTTTFNNTGNASDLHISYDAGTSTTFNGPVVINENSSPAGEIWFGNDGTVAFNNNITINNLSGNSIYLTHGAGTTTLGNGTITTGTFASGTLSFSNFTQTGTLAINTTLTGTAILDFNPAVTFNGPVTFVAPQIYLDGATFVNNAYLEKTGGTNNTGNGGNTFQGTTTIKNSGTANLRTDGNNTFSGSTTIENAGSGDVLLELTASTNSYNDVAFINSGSSSIRVGYLGTTNFNGNITVSSTGGTGVLFCESATATAILANSKTISVSGTFSTGRLDLQRFTQVGTTAQTLSGITGTGRVDLGPSSDFGGNVTVIAPQLILDGTIFRGTAYLEKTGATNNAGAGGNTFMGTTSIVNSGSNYLLTGNTNPDVFSGNLTVTNSGSDIIHLAYNTTNNQFNGNITFNSTGSSAAIYICNQAGATATMAIGSQLQIGTFNTGRLSLRRLQQLGSEDQSLLLTNTALLEVGPSTSFNGNVNFSAPQFELDGVTFNGPVSTTLAKTGATNNDSQGGNIFNSPSTIISNSGSGNFRFAVSALDSFNNNVEFTNTGSGTIRLADVIPGTVFNGNIKVNCTGSGGVYFSESSGGNSTIASGKSISVGPTGFTNGELHIRRFTQSDAATSQTINMNSAGTGLILVGPTVSFAGVVDFRAPQIQLNGATYNNTAYIEKTGATDNTGSGGNEFKEVTTLVNSGSGNFIMGGTNPDIFRKALTVTHTGSNRFFIADASAGNLFEGTVTINYGGTTATGNNLHLARNAGATATINGTLTVNCTAASSGSGVRIGNDGTVTVNANIVVSTTSGRGISFGTASGTVTQPTGYTFTAGTFSTGDLLFSHFTKGTDATTLALTGNATITVNNSSTFNGNLTVTSPGVYLNGGIFNGTTAFTKNGTGNNDDTGGNSFNGATTITNSSTARLRLAATSADVFSGSATFVKASSGALEPAYVGTNQFANNITINSNAVLTFGASTGIVEFTGGNAQSVNRVDALTHTFSRISLNKSGNAVTLNAPVNVSTSATFTNGILNTTSTNLLSLAAGSTVTGASNASFVDGPVRKIGNTAFTFPIGNSSYYRPLAISAPTNVAHYFDAQYLKTNHGLALNYDPTFWSVSSCEYWTLNRNSGASSNVFVTLSWLVAACNTGYVTTPADLRVTQWSGTMWTNQGNSAVTGTAASGTVTSGAAVASYGTFTLASITSLNPLPIELLYFKGNLSEQNNVYLEWTTATEENNDYFTLERSFNGQDFDFLKKEPGSGTRVEPKVYSFIDKTAHAQTGNVYYRLSQTDYNGAKKQLGIVRVQIHASDASGFLVYPNPNTTRKFTVEGKFSHSNRASLIDMTGRTVQIFEWTGNSQKIELLINDLPSGSYMLQLQTSEGITEMKRVVLIQP